MTTFFLGILVILSFLPASFADDTMIKTVEAELVIKDTTAAAAALLSPSTTTSSITPSRFICTLVDGSVYSLDTYNGQVEGLFATGRPLVGTSSNKIVPGLDGKLYIPQDTTGTLQELPLTMEDLIRHPVRTCSDDDDDINRSRECGVVTGAKVTSLYGLNAEGLLEWTSQADKSYNRGSSTDTVVVLQREDYIIKQVSTQTGEQEWNVTLGRFSALDFDFKQDSESLDDIGEEDMDDDDDDDDEPERLLESGKKALSTTGEIHSLPSVAFDDTGTMLTVFDEKEVLWRRRLPSVIASVYGLDNGQWVSLQVTKEPKLRLGQHHDSTTALVTQALPSQQRQLDAFWKQHLHPFLRRQAQENTALQVYASPLTQEAAQQFMVNSNIFAQQLALAATDDETDDVDCMDSENGFCGSTANEEPPQEQMGETLMLSGDSEEGLLPPEKGGLFLSWSVVAAIVVGMMGVMVGLSILYEHKKRKWLEYAVSQTPPLVPSNPSSNSHDLVPELSLDALPLHSQYHNLISVAGNTKDYASDDHRSNIARSMSLPTFHSKHSTSPVRQHSVPVEKTSTSQSRSGFPSNSTSTSDGAPSSNNPPSLPPAANIGGIPLVQYSRYRSEFKELSPLGKGGFGTVFCCENALDGRQYAIKKVWIPYMNDKSNSNNTRDRLQRVLREVKILALLDHPNIVRYYTAWLEVEPDNNDGGNEYSLSTSDYYLQTSTQHRTAMTKCYSSELFLHSNPYERPSDMGRRKNKPKATPANPLGWNNFIEDDFSSASFRRNDVSSASSDFEDYGFTFERSESERHRRVSLLGTIKSTDLEEEGDEDETDENKNNESLISFSGTTTRQTEEKKPARTTTTNRHRQDNATTTNGTASETDQPAMRHTLYIQMQLCSQNSLGDFLMDEKARKGDRKQGIDVPYALSLFHQAARGVQHVHEQGLIHRDLKPSNCFLDDNGIVKVGDFGLSRESSANGDNADMDLSRHGSSGDDNENTAGVGTRSYASPEQIDGSVYDASTDVYSLGIMLFELCYPMYTGMERHIMFSRIRKRDFPCDWMETMARSFPALHQMLGTMLSPIPSERPSSEMVARHLERLLSEFTVMSLDRTHSEETGATLLRVEADQKDGVLTRTIQSMQSASVKVIQYGLRSGGDKTIMEFALANVDSVDSLLDMLQASPEIHVARRISHGNQRDLRLRLSNE